MDNDTTVVIYIRIMVHYNRKIISGYIYWNNEAFLSKNKHRLLVGTTLLLSFHFG